METLPSVAAGVYCEPVAFGSVNLLEGLELVHSLMSPPAEEREMNRGVGIDLPSPLLGRLPQVPLEASSCPPHVITFFTEDGFEVGRVKGGSAGGWYPCSPGG